MSIIINFQQLGPQDAFQLFSFLQAQAKLGRKVWHKNVLYQFENGIEFQFDHDFYQRSRKEGHDGVRYEIISNDAPIGRGTYGIVRKIEGTLAFNENQYRFKQQHKNGLARAVKIQTIRKTREETTNEQLEKVNKEYQITKNMPHLSAKEPTIVEINPDVRYDIYNTMDLFPGKELKDILDDDAAGIRVLTTKERLELTLAILYAFRAQVAVYGVIHRDIKPENILVHMGPPIIVNIIDYNLSFRAGDTPEARMRGTPLYMAQEGFYQPVTVSEKSDVFSLGRVIAEIWHVSQNTYDEDNNTFYSVANYSAKERVAGLFNGINDLSNKARLIIYNTLRTILKNTPSKRFSLDEVIEQFEQIDNQVDIQPIPVVVPFPPPPASGVLAQFSLFAQKNDSEDEIEEPVLEKKTGFTDDEMKLIQDTIKTLKKEIDSWWPYPNKSRKQHKVDGLNALILYSTQSDDVLDAISKVEEEYKDLRRGSISTRTADLLDQLKSNHALSYSISSLRNS